MKRPGNPAMKRPFRIGDHVTWNSEAGRVAGRIVKVHTKNVNYRGYIHHASKDEPQYAIKSDTTDHVALHKGSRAEARLAAIYCGKAAVDFFGGLMSP
jgi:hypothetical protein